MSVELGPCAVTRRVGQSASGGDDWSLGVDASHSRPAAAAAAAEAAVVHSSRHGTVFGDFVLPAANLRRRSMTAGEGPRESQSFTACEMFSNTYLDVKKEVYYLYNLRFLIQFYKVIIALVAACL